MLTVLFIFLAVVVQMAKLWVTSVHIGYTVSSQYDIRADATLRSELTNATIYDRSTMVYVSEHGTGSHPSIRTFAYSY
jgi:cell division protein FtsI/penicillin-binding protein 2